MNYLAKKMSKYIQKIMLWKSGYNVDYQSQTER